VNSTDQKFSENSEPYYGKGDPSAKVESQNSGWPQKSSLFEGEPRKSPYIGYDLAMPITADEASGKQLAQSVLALQDRRRREIAAAANSQMQRNVEMLKAEVARQQAGFLDEMAKDAVAPEVERGTFSERHGDLIRRAARGLEAQGDGRGISGQVAGSGGGNHGAARGQAAQSGQVPAAESGDPWNGHPLALAAIQPTVDCYNDTVTLTSMQWDGIMARQRRADALEKRVQWLVERGDQHAKLIARLQARCSELEQQPARPVSYGNGLDTQVSVAPTVSVPLTRGKIATMLVVDEAIKFGDSSAPTSACNHEFFGKDSTIVVITRKKTRCTVCAQVWEST
jgi:hypothetical protein